jgi:serine/threonine-protein kinase
LVWSTPHGVQTILAMPVASADGSQLGFVALVDEQARIFPLDAVDHLRSTTQRLHTELAWRSVHERIAADRDRLRESSMLDPMLAGVWTRAALDQTLAGEVSAATRRGEPMSFAVVDLRGLRHLNERYGHVVGDDALRHVASLVRSTVRTQDVVARYAGDTLALVLAGTPLEQGKRAVERIQEAVSVTPLIHGEELIPLQVVAGLAPLLGADDTGDAALSRAMAALKQAKRRREPIGLAEGTDAVEAGLPATQGLEAGTTLGGMYQILHEISRGAMGVVYRAEDLGLGRPVALKTLRPDLARDRNFVERFRAEASTLAALRHENLVQVYAFGADGEDVYFVMELVEGEPLEDRVEMARHEGKMMTFDEVTHVIAQIADALDAMHRAGILHRDVKPANILLDRVRSRAVLVDVGIAKKRGSPTDPAGTPGFTAPESFTGAAEGAQADVYGLAATAYTLLSTEVPFRGANVEEILRSQMHTGPLPASSIRAGIPAQVDAVLQKSLDPDPARRHARATEFAGALAAALREGAAATAPTPTPPPVPADAASAARRVRRATGSAMVEVAVPEPLADGSTAVVEVPDREPDTAVRQKPIVVEPPPPPPAPVAPVTPPPPTAAPRPPPISTQARVAAGVAGTERRPTPPPIPAMPPPPPQVASDAVPEEVEPQVSVSFSVGGKKRASLTGSHEALVGPSAPAAMIPSLREPDAPAANVPHTRGVLFRSSYRVLGARHGAAWVAHVSRRHPALAQALQPQSTLLSWHPTDLFVTMLGAIAQSGRDAKAFARELGRVATGATFSRFFGANPAALSPWHVLSAAEHFWRRYHTWGVVAVERDGDLGARVTIMSGPRDPLVCACTAGILEQVVTLSGAPQGDVTHPSCEATGAGTCEFAVRWQPAKAA